MSVEFRVKEKREGFGDFITEKLASAMECEVEEVLDMLRGGVEGETAEILLKELAASLTEWARSNLDAPIVFRPRFDETGKYHKIEAIAPVKVAGEEVKVIVDEWPAKYGQVLLESESLEDLEKWVSNVAEKYRKIKSFAENQ